MTVPLIAVMKTIVVKDPLHIRLLNLLVAIRDLSPFHLMTAEEEQLLRTLLIRWHEEKYISVSGITNSMADVSGATVYRRIIALRDKGLISLRVNQADRRVKFVEPTRLALDYGNRIDIALDAILRGGPSG